MLPIEILQMIAAAAPWSYFGLIQSCKAIGINFPLMTAELMKKFTTQRYGRPGDLFPRQLAWRLPNGYLHCIDNDTPTMKFDTDVEDGKIKQNGYIIVLYSPHMMYTIYHNDYLHYYYNKLHRYNNLPAVYTKKDDEISEDDFRSIIYFTHGVHYNVDCSEQN